MNKANEMVERMKALAERGHKGAVRRYTGVPYVTHPAKVVEMLEGWGYAADEAECAVSLAIAWGHDLLEDTKVTVGAISRAARCDAVVDGIQALTFRPEAFPEIADWDDKKAAYIRRIGAEARPGVLVVKMADRLCNTLDFCEAGDAWATEYLALGEPLFARLDECRGAERIRATLSLVREKVATVRDLGFPKVLSASALRSFVTTARGCTRPRVGKIGGHRFIAKCGSWSAYSSDDHVHNEVVADYFLRAAGLNVPPSREYRVNFCDGRGDQTIRLAVYDDALMPIMQAWGMADEARREKIRRQVVAAYPVQALVAGIDTFTWDNVKVDTVGDLWFVDNGASFDYRACGKKKGWFWERQDVHDPMTGYLSLANHPDQGELREILGRVDADELWEAARDVDFVGLVRRLPVAYRRETLEAYALRLNEAKSRTCRIDRDKAKGMLWGLLVGDALGSPIQFSERDSHPWITKMEPCAQFGVGAGCWTDDGSMALCVMDSFVRKGGYDLADIGATFVKWLDEGYLSSKEGKAFDVGCATWTSVNAIRRGSLKNGREESQGNGSIMRFAPGYLIARALERPGIVHEVSDLTHDSKVVRKTCDELAGVLDDHLVGVRTEAGPAGWMSREQVPNSGWCVDTLSAALWAFNATESFEEGMVAAVNLGGDSDTIGAVYGQIAGAYYGFEAIPPRWVKAMKASEELDRMIERFLDALP